MEVTLIHPRKGETLLVEIDPSITAKQILNALMDAKTGPFLPPLRRGEGYELMVRSTNMSLPSHMTAREAGVMDEDIIEVVIAGQGA
jgi:hypothetical protein